MSEALNNIENYRREVLRELYNCCTEAQQKFFCRMYKSVDEIDDSKIDWAIKQCERTIASNIVLNKGE
jgi:hypothetical protein